MHTGAHKKQALLGIAAGLFVTALSACDAPNPTASSDFDVAAPMAASVTSSDAPLHQVEVNAKHGNARGVINLRGAQNGNGKDAGNYGPQLTVSVLGTGDFDMSTIVWSSILIGDATTTPNTPVTEKSNKYQGSIVDLNGDGILDLQLHFSIEDMIANGNLSESTTTLCLVGAGDGFRIAGTEDVQVMPYAANPDAGESACGGSDDNGGGDDDDGGDDDGGNGNGNGNGNGPGSGTTFVETDIIPFWPETSGDKVAWVAQIPWWLLESDDAVHGYPGWITQDLSAFPGGPWASREGGLGEWTVQPLPIGSEEEPRADGFLMGTCGFPESQYRWQIDNQLLMRTDIDLPAGAQNIVVEYVVDNDAAVYWNGTLVSRDFQTAQNNGCASYSRTVTVKIPAELLAADGNNKLAIWARDFGYVNYFDLRVVGELPAGN